MRSSGHKMQNYIVSDDNQLSYFNIDRLQVKEAWSRCLDSRGVSLSTYIDLIIKKSVRDYWFV